MQSVRIIQKLSRLSRHTSRSSRLFLDYPDTFSRLSGHFLDCPETFQFIRTLCILSGYFVSRNSSANNELVAKTLRICKNFPVSIADALTGFLRLCMYICACTVCMCICEYVSMCVRVYVCVYE